VWWQWALGVQVSQSPLFDQTGVNAYNGQPYSDLLFLGGTFIVTQAQNGDVLGQATRSIAIRRGTALFFPLLNGEWDNVGFTPHLGGTTPSTGVLGVPGLRAIVEAAEDNATGLYAMLRPTDASFQQNIGPVVNLAYPRLKSPPFSYVLPRTDNVVQFFGVNASGTVAPAAGDGYFSYVPGTLTPGYYKLEFGGILPDSNGQKNKFTEVITYLITVLP